MIPGSFAPFNINRKLAKEGLSVLEEDLDDVTEKLQVKNDRSFQTSSLEGSFFVKVEDEVIKVLKGKGTNVWTVARGQWGTPKAAHVKGSEVQQLIQGHHCLVCEFGLRPVVLVFAREKPPSKDDKGNEKAPLEYLIAKLDQAVDRHRERFFLGSFLVVLSPAGRNSATEGIKESVPGVVTSLAGSLALGDQWLPALSGFFPGRMNPENQLVEEAQEREDLVLRLQEKAGKWKLKNVVISFFPEEGPKGFNLHPEAAITVVFYEKQRVLANFAFSDGKLDQTQVDGILQAVENILTGKKGS